MEKICIVKRRRPVQENRLLPQVEPQAQDHSPLLSLELTSQQAETVRSNTYFQHLYSDSGAPIFLNFHFAENLPQKMLTCKDICRMLQVSRHTLDKLVKSGQIRSYRIGRLRRFSTENVMNYLAHGCEPESTRGARVDVVTRPEMKFEASCK